ncbi:MAG: UDP-N-acetylmuramate--L-alanine ligase [Elusimicrobiota bacterium]|nr:UDP-N-acetylmuramate--L-alanine ligase [Elusimicrobiota bacterium]
MFEKVKHIHLVGIGGSGMSGIAEILLNLGYKISGSDLIRSDVTRHLESLGAKIFYKHRRENMQNADVVVVSSAISKDNIEVISAQKNKIPVIPRIEMLSELARIKYAITVAGTHGKTTITSMVGLVLEHGGFDPTVIIGGRVKNFGLLGKPSGAKLGAGEYLVTETDESDGSFLRLSPTVAIVSNIDNDHLDFYGNFNNLKNAFVEHINSIPFYGFAVLCSDDKPLRATIKKVHRKYFTYGLNSADYTAKNINLNFYRSKFDVFQFNRRIGTVELNVPGRHNIPNALAAICCGMELGIPFNKIQVALKEFSGVNRRLEIKGEVPFGLGKLTFIDDYGHHPTEIQVTIKTIKENFPNRRLLVIFQPHRYTRTKILYKEFTKAFKYADVVKIVEIYPAGEKPIPGVSSELILHGLKKLKPDASTFNFNKFVQEILPNDVILTLGAGDVWKIGEKLISFLNGEKRGTHTKCELSKEKPIQN